jgi:hypothetical protein
MSDLDQPITGVKNILSFGAGVQSTTLLLMSCEGVLPRLDHVIFADTQWEPEAVYRHLEWCREHAAKCGITIDTRSAGNLRDDLIEFWGPRRKSADGKRYASIPAFVANPDGSRGIVRRQCTSEYKINVIERYVREAALGLAKGQRWPKNLSVIQWIGISADEPQRMKRSTRPAVKFWHPLIEADQCAIHDGRNLFDRGMTRDDCLRWLMARGYPRPPRSACIGCPFHSNAEWAKLTPTEFSDACDVDDEMRNRERQRRTGDVIGLPYLHPSLIPLREVDLSRAVDNELTWGDECQGVCGV